MSAQRSNAQSACFLGVKAFRNGFEIHAVNARDEVVLQGWFHRDAGVSLISNRPASVIAMDAATVQPELAALWAHLGHSIFVMPATNELWSTRAKDLCWFGVTLSSRMN